MLSSLSLSFNFCFSFFFFYFFLSSPFPLYACFVLLALLLLACVFGVFLCVVAVVTHARTFSLNSAAIGGCCCYYYFAASSLSVFFFFCLSRVLFCFIYLLLRFHELFFYVFFFLGLLIFFFLALLAYFLFPCFYSRFLSLSMHRSVPPFIPPPPSLHYPLFLKLFLYSPASFFFFF